MSTPQSPTSTPGSQSSDPTQVTETLNHLKRRITQLEEENEKLRSRRKRGPSERETTLARGIRKIVSLHVPLKVLIDEFDRRETAESDDENGEGATASSPSDTEQVLKRELQGLFSRSYLQKVLEQEGFLEHLKAVSNWLWTELLNSHSRRQWERPADEARGDDIKRLKVEVANWLNTLDKDDLQVLSEYEDYSFVTPHTRLGRGFQNITTGRLLCPIDYDWNDLYIRSRIQEMHPDYPTHEKYLLRFLYAGYSGDPEDFMKGFLKSTLMVRTFKHIFTSSSSALLYTGEDDPSSDTENTTQPLRKRRQIIAKEPSKKNVASLLGMTTVTPRAIAYTAVMLHFALTNAAYWNLINDGFNYAIFYDFIVDTFEDRELTGEDEVKELLQWWNRQIFGNRLASSGEEGNIAFRKHLSQQKNIRAARARLANARNRQSSQGSSATQQTRSSNTTPEQSQTGSSQPPPTS
ncbi:hypothetical protein VNI00_016551 [Paramarasmius palmivorus]|uniref:Uncharacterized protein n=1 Tax=Paramarasmius palmivorus TaxID=297713 RepID=A0AAW0BCN2_9AGAR